MSQAQFSKLISRELSTDQDDTVGDWVTFGLAQQTEIDSPRLRQVLLARLDQARCALAAATADPGSVGMFSPAGRTVPRSIQTGRYQQRSGSGRNSDDRP